MADNNFVRNWVGLFILGSINNLPYVIVTSAAKTIADSFNERNQVGLVFGANVALSVLVKGLNGFFLLKVKYWIRYVVNAALMLIGCVVGAGGQNQVKLRHLTNYAFLLTTPAVALYLIAYFFIIKHPRREEVERQESQGNIQQEDETKHLKSDSDEVSAIFSESLHTTVEESTGRRIFRCLKLVLWMAFNLCGVYMFEYVAQGCAAKVRPKSEYNVGCPELYAALSLCYQAGVFVSRSSVQLMQIQRVEILTILQFLNMIVWIVDVHDSGKGKLVGPHMRLK